MANSIDTVSIIGYGNVGSHLAQAFIENGVNVSHIYSRSFSNQELFDNNSTKIIDDFQLLPKNQLTIVCVPDDAIRFVLNQIDDSIPVAYTSGSVEIERLPSRKNLGVFYPLQSFTKGKDVNIFEVPFFIESNNEYFTSTLFDLAWKISRTVKYATSEYRSNLHVSAVMVNNFTNHILHLAKLFAEEKNVDFDHLTPLLHETINKLKNQSAFDAQTGPARRGDTETVKNQLMKLNGTSKDIYALLSESIQNTYLKND